MKNLENLSSEEIVILGTAISFELSRNKSKKEIYVIQKLLTQISFLLSTLNK